MRCRGIPSLRCDIEQLKPMYLAHFSRAISVRSLQLNFASSNWLGS
jgi:hypothetical protein